jgi:hypothetical protein
MVYIGMDKIAATYRMQDRADCPEKELVYKWLRVAEIQTGDAL